MEAPDSCQFMNQTFNSVVNYTNRNASTAVSTSQLLQAYAGATTASVVTALSLNRFVASRPSLSNGIVGRLVPFLAVAAANCVNIPLMRQRELIDGVDVKVDDNVIGKSAVAAKQAVMQVIPSRILMATPGMIIPPLLMNSLEKTAVLRANPVLKAPLTVLLTGLCLTFSTPMCCAIYSQESTIPTSVLEEDLQVRIRELKPESTHATYNKGL